MKKVLRITGKALLILLIAVALFFGVMYLVTMGDYQVAQTVQHDPSIPHLEINGTTLHVETFGSDTSRPVVVVHGGPGYDFRYLLSLKELAEDYFVIFYDQRGSGLSERIPAEELNLENSISDLDAIINHFAPNKKVNIIGHSWGAMLSSAYLGRYPGKVNKIVLAEPGILVPEMASMFQERTNGLAAEFSFPLVWHIVKSWFESLHVEKIDAGAKNDYFLARLIFDYKGENHPLRGYYCGGRLPEEIPIWRWGALAAFTIPNDNFDDDGNFTANLTTGVQDFSGKVLFLTGACDTYLSKDFQEMNMRYFNNAHMVLVENSGHYMFSDNPNACNRIVSDFFCE
nr:alpha/beta hydrolase [Bacteroidota bacterium]